MQGERKIVSKNADMISVCGDQSIPERLVSVDSGSMCSLLQPMKTKVPLQDSNRIWGKLPKRRL